MDKQDNKNLKKRYLIWLYKTTREAFDKFERKFTQSEIDKDILQDIENTLMGAYLPHEKAELEKLVNGFREYILAKENTCQGLKSRGLRINPEFIFLEVKLGAIEKSIIKELGRRGLEEIKSLYENEMTQRILKNTESH